MECPLFVTCAFSRIHAHTLTLTQTHTLTTNPFADSVKLSLATVKLATTFEDLANMWSDAPKTSELPWIDVLKEYVGLLGQFNDAIQSSKSASLKVECVRV